VLTLESLHATKLAMLEPISTVLNTAGTVELGLALLVATVLLARYATAVRRLLPFVGAATLLFALLYVLHTVGLVVFNF
jgi:hypothetical protein